MIAIIVAGSNFERLPGIMKRFQENMDRKLSGLLALIGEQIVGTAREDYLSGPRPSKLGRISGDLARSVFYRVQESSVVVGSNLPYAPVHEFGATIKAMAAPFLVFKTLDGSWHSKKRVRIPARPFMTPAISDSKEKIRALAAGTFQEAYREARGG